MKLHIGDITIEGTAQEIKEYIGDDIVPRSTEDQEEFTVVFKNCDGEVSSESLKGDDAAYLEPIIQAFMRAYDKSGFRNELTITIGNKIFGDKTYKVEEKRGVKV